jgi:peptidyl-prolyl cis-trans isomerase D
MQVEGGYVWLEVAGITAARDRTLDEVKAQVEARWREDETTNRLKAKATDILDKVKAGTPLADVAAAAGLKVESKPAIKRGEAAAPLSAPAIDAIFRTPKDGTGSAAAEQPAEQIVFRVTDIVVPPADANSQASKSLQETLNRALADDIFGEYVARLQDEIGVTINQAALKQVVTGTAVPDDDSN